MIGGGEGVGLLKRGQEKIPSNISGCINVSKSVPKANRDFIELHTVTTKSKARHIRAFIISIKSKINNDSNKSSIENFSH